MRGWKTPVESHAKRNHLCIIESIIDSLKVEEKINDEIEKAEKLVLIQCILE